MCPDTSGIVAAAILEPSSRIAPIFVGKSGYGTILDAAGGAADRHFFIPASAEASLAAEDLEYLKVKGCFTLPEESRELVEAYFRFVHPVFPVIDASTFMQDYAKSGIAGINLLLLWSMFSVSASYLPKSPQKTYKEQYVQRAKLLFDLSEEKDKIVLVQSALLLSFWFADTEDVKQSWYWTGIAFSISQTLGLQQESVLTDPGTEVPERQRGLWCNIWHCCMIRDVWLAFSMGRPLRINTTDNGESRCKHQHFNFQALYSPREASEMESLWQDLITTSTVLRDVMANTTPSSSRLESLEKRVSLRDLTQATSVLANAEQHLKLHQYATLLALARAGGSNTSLIEFADHTTSLIEAILHDKVHSYSAPVTVPLIVPAMVTYLKMLKVESIVDANLAITKIGVYIRFLSTLEDNYPAALIVKRIICVAQEALIGEQVGSNERQEAAGFGTVDQDTLGNPSLPLSWFAPNGFPSLLDGSHWTSNGDDTHF
jgi:hypothetical protein